MTVAVLTSIYGGYDQLAHPPVQTLDAEWLCVTDNFGMNGHGAWKIVPRPCGNQHPRLAAKIAKCSPTLFTNAEVTVWMDGSCRFRDETSLERLVADTAGATISQFPHPHRDCLFDEASFSANLSKYRTQPILDQAHRYRVLGMPTHWGLWCTGLIVRRGPLIDFGNSWLAEQFAWTNQDQVSEPYVLREHGLRPEPIPGHLLVNDYVTWIPHADGT